jgi:hypothetical protein
VTVKFLYFRCLTTNIKIASRCDRGAWGGSTAISNFVEKVQGLHVHIVELEHDGVELYICGDVSGTSHAMK